MERGESEEGKTEIYCPYPAALAVHRHAGNTFRFHIPLTFCRGRKLKPSLLKRTESPLQYLTPSDWD